MGVAAKRFLIVSFFIFLCYHDVFSQPVTAPKREFRGVWMATVVNIDWPSKTNLSTAAQQQELITMLDKHEKAGINAIMFQVRPAADAFYAKGNEPWSKWLTGKQGREPRPFYDPLEFIIIEAHKRGMELHAWFNPYRATFDENNKDIADEHITKTKPEWFFSYGGKKLFNPGIPEVREYIKSTILNVVDQYDIDGVHFDDYFYPYSVPGQMIQDNETFAQYGQEFSSIEDWRRSNVDSLIQSLGDSIHKHKSYVKYGISPFGIWKNKKQDSLGSETNGFSSFSGLYADSRKWIEQGWVDYINPQVYFSFTSAVVPYAKLVDWWSNNTYGRHLYIGIGAYKIAERKEMAWRSPNQIPNQIVFNRQNPRVQGEIYFSSKSLTNNLAGIADSLANNFYRYKSLPPSMIWLDSVAPNKPQKLLVKNQQGSNYITWEKPLMARDNEPVYGYIIYRFEQGEPFLIDSPKNILKIKYDAGTAFTDIALEEGKNYNYVVTAIDRLKNESEVSETVFVNTASTGSN